MSLRSSEEDGVLVVGFQDTKILDDARIQELGKQLLQKATETPSGKMVLNFEGVSFMSSAMIGKLVLLNKKAKASQKELRFRNIAPNVYEVFKITRLNKIFKIETAEEAG